MVYPFFFTVHSIGITSIFFFFALCKKGKPVYVALKASVCILTLVTVEQVHYNNLWILAKYFALKNIEYIEM